MAEFAAAARREGHDLFSSLQPIGEPETVGAMIARNADRLGRRLALIECRGGGRGFRWHELHEAATAFARFLVRSGVRPGDRVVAVSPNRAEMLVAELGTMTAGAVWVPIFPGYPPAQTRELVARPSPRILVVPDARALERTGLPDSVHAAVVFDTQPAPGGGPATVSLPEALALGTAEPAHPLPEVTPATAALIMYTSGTSGRFKGVVLTHDNILSQQRALAAVWRITPDDRFLSYLPWHHSFGGIFEKYLALANGAPLHLDDSQGKDIDRLVANWTRIRPTVYFSVPKVYQLLVARAEAQREMDALIVHPGLRFVFTAAAPLPQNLADFFAARRIPVLEGWGLTETAPCCTLTDAGEERDLPGVVGYPIPGVRVRIAPDGEILIRGPNVMQGYFEDPDATSAARTADGWFRTGDLGTLAGLRLRLVTRKDRVFKLLNAEKVVPTAIENRLADLNAYIRHVIVVGSGRSHLTALVFPDYFRIAEEFGNDRATADREVKRSLGETMQAFNRDHPVPYERIRAFAVIGRELSVEGNELTASQKVRVHEVLEHSAGYLDAMYEPERGCDCRFLRKILRLDADPRPCPAGLERTLDHCHECGSVLFDDTESLMTDDVELR